jgi:hypothetical protein
MQPLTLCTLPCPKGCVFQICSVFQVEDGHGWRNTQVVTLSE